jgi:hypothetical protein
MENIFFLHSALTKLTYSFLTSFLYDSSFRTSVIRLILGLSHFTVCFYDINFGDISLWVKQLEYEAACSSSYNAAVQNT